MNINKYFSFVLLLFTFLPSYSQNCSYPKIDQQHNFNYTCEGTIVIQEKIDKSSGTLRSKSGSVIDNGKIDGGSNITINAKACTINDKIDGSSTVAINCEENVWIGNKIDGGSQVTINSYGSVHIGDKIDNGSTRVKIICTGDITIVGKVDGGCIIDLWTGNGHIHIMGKADNSNTGIHYHSKYPIQIDGGANRAHILPY